MKTVFSLLLLLANSLMAQTGDQKEIILHLQPWFEGRPLILQEEEALQVSRDIDFDTISFQLGTDSLTNVSGVMGGDLDPTQGMYWAWNSGYINFKLEDRSPLCPARKQLFQFHLGGYQAPFETVQTLQLKAQPSDTLNIYVDVSKFLNNVDLSTQHSIMSPSAEAQRLSLLASTLFSCDAPEQTHE